MKALLASLLTLSTCAPTSAPPSHDIHAYPCRPGIVVLWHASPSPCDLVAPDNTLTLLGLPEGECERLGGTPTYEACDRVDF